MGNEKNDQCPVKVVLDRLGDKWTIHSVLLLGEGKALRFGELKNSIAGISQRMLTVTLRNLEEDGIVERTIFAEIPPHVEYKLTKLGQSLHIQFVALLNWAEENKKDILNSRIAYASKNQ